MEQSPARNDAPPRPGQPMPTRTKYVHHGMASTAILRTWASPDAVKACRLCPCGRCSADAHLQCLIVVGRHVPAAECPLYVDDSAPADPDPPPRFNVLSP